MLQLNENEQKQKEEIEAEEERGSLQRELAHIDEQMERLRKLNELEIRREKVVEKAKV